MFRRLPDALERAAELDVRYGRNPDLETMPMYGVVFSFMFRAEPGREDVLLRIASAYEAATKRRVPPPAFGPLPADVGDLVATLPMCPVSSANAHAPAPTAAAKERPICER
jgi:hypothetical protein